MLRFLAVNVYLFHIVHVFTFCPHTHGAEVVPHIVKIKTLVLFFQFHHFKFLISISSNIKNSNIKWSNNLAVFTNSSYTFRPVTKQKKKLRGGTHRIQHCTHVDNSPAALFAARIYRIFAAFALTNNLRLFLEINYFLYCKIYLK